jgi:type VI secretion system protein ImpJ
MFLRPHHFQAADRHWMEALTAASQFDHGYNYGIRWLDYSREAIGNFQFELKACHARLRDGTLIVLGPGQPVERQATAPAFAAQMPAPVDLQGAFDRQERVLVYVGVPRLKLGSVNVARANEPAHGHRYVEVREQVQDEERGGNDQDLQFRQLNVRVLLETDGDLKGYEVLPIARLQRATDRTSTPAPDPSYFPPLLAVDAWPDLSSGVFRAVYDMIGAKIDLSAQWAREYEADFDALQPGDLPRLLKLGQLNGAQGVLSTLAFVRGLHPLLAYAELCRIAGQLSLFDRSRRLGQLPPYDHDNLGNIFIMVREEIRRLLEDELPQFERRPFRGVLFKGRDQVEKPGMQVDLPPHWLKDEWDWFVGVACEGFDPRNCEKFLNRTLYWKLASPARVEDVFQHAKPGLKLDLLEQPPRPLPSRGGWSYFRLVREGDGAQAWRHVIAEKAMGMRLKSELVNNIATLPGNSKLELKYDLSGSSRRVSLEFALFAVRRP